MDLNNFIKKRGYCSFTKDEVLTSKTDNIPDGYGVYIFHKNRYDGEVLYIGKSGTLEQNGQYKKQNLRKRLNNKQDTRVRDKNQCKKLNRQLEKVADSLGNIIDI